MVDSINPGGYGFDIKRINFHYIDKFATPKKTAFVSRVSKEAVSIDELPNSSESADDHINGQGLQHIIAIAPQIADWQKMFKKNAWLSLGPFYRPDGDWRTQKGELLRQDTRDWLTDQLLGKELRWRAALEEELLLDTFSISGSTALILACGSGIYPIKAAHRCQESISDLDRKQYKKPHLTMVDINPRAIKFVKDFANTQTVRVNVIARDILHTKGFNRDNLNSIIARFIKEGKFPPVSMKRIAPEYNIVTMIGLSMYLPDNNFSYGLTKKLKIGSTRISVLAEPEKLGMIEVIKKMWSHARDAVIFDIVRKPDSSLGSEAVRLQHKVIEMMGWPTFQLRTVDDVLRMIAESGINPSSIEIYESPLDFFIVFKINKHKQ